MLFFRKRENQVNVKDYILAREIGIVRRREFAFASSRYAQSKLNAARIRNLKVYLLSKVSQPEIYDSFALFSALAEKGNAGIQKNGEEKMSEKEGRTIFTLSDAAEKYEIRKLSLLNERRKGEEENNSKPKEQNTDQLDFMIEALSGLRGLNVWERGGQSD